MQNYRSDKPGNRRLKKLAKIWAFNRLKEMEFRMNKYGLSQDDSTKPKDTKQLELIKSSDNRSDTRKTSSSK